MGWNKPNSRALREWGWRRSRPSSFNRSGRNRERERRRGRRNPSRRPPSPSPSPSPSQIAPRPSMALRTIAARTRGSALRLASPAPAPCFSPPATRVFPPAAARPTSSSIAPPVMPPGLSAPCIRPITRPISSAAFSGGITVRTSPVHGARCMSSLPSWMSSLGASDPAEVFSKLNPESKEALYLAHLMLSHFEEAQSHELLVLRTLLLEIQDGQGQLWSILGDILGVTALGFISLLLFLEDLKDDTTNLLEGLTSNLDVMFPKLMSAVKHELPIYFGRGEPFVWDNAWTKPKDKKGPAKGGENAVKQDKKGPVKGGQATVKKDKRPGKWF